MFIETVIILTIENYKEIQTNNEVILIVEIISMLLIDKQNTSVNKTFHI